MNYKNTNIEPVRLRTLHGSDDDLPHNLQRYLGCNGGSETTRIARSGYILIVRIEDQDSVAVFNSELKFLRGSGLFVETPTYHADGVIEFQLLADNEFFANFNRQFNVMGIDSAPNAIGELFKKLFLQSIESEPVVEHDKFMA